MISNGWTDVNIFTELFHQKQIKHANNKLKMNESVSVNEVVTAGTFTPDGRDFFFTLDHLFVSYSTAILF